MSKLNSIFDNEMDPVECVMIANGEDLMDEAAVDDDVKKIEEDDEDDYYDETIENMGATFTMADLVVNEFRETQDHLMDSINEELVDLSMMDIDPDVEDLEDDDDDYYYDEDDDVEEY